MGTRAFDVPAARWHRRAVALVAALLLLDILWEMMLAPLRPGGTWLALKAIPLVLVWEPLRRGSRRARQAASLLLPLYIAEGAVRTFTETGRHAIVAALATVIALAAFAAILATFRAERTTD